MRTILWNYFDFGPLVQEKMAFKDVLSRALEARLFSGAEPFLHFLVKGILRNNSVKLL